VAEAHAVEPSGLMGSVHDALGIGITVHADNLLAIVVALR
jgi:hypothetical protein